MLSLLKGFYDTLGLLGISLIVFSLGGAIGLSTGHTLFGVVCLFFIFGILSRLPCTYSDAIKDVECVSSSAFLLTMVGGPWLGAVFAFSGMWISKWVSPWGKGEDFSYVLADAISMVIAAFFIPWLYGWTGHQIIPTMFWFYVIRFVVYFITIPIMHPATIVTSGFLTFVGFFIAITQAFIVVYFIGPYVFSAFGLHGWSMGALPILQPH
jgi:hypothetical protein